MSSGMRNNRAAATAMDSSSSSGAAGAMVAQRLSDAGRGDCTLCTYRHAPASFLYTLPSDSFILFLLSLLLSFRAFLLIPSFYFSLLSFLLSSSSHFRILPFFFRYSFPLCCCSVLSFVLFRSSFISSFSFLPRSPLSFLLCFLRSCFSHPCFILRVFPRIFRFSPGYAFLLLPHFHIPFIPLLTVLPFFPFFFLIPCPIYSTVHFCEFWGCSTFQTLLRY